MTRKRLWIGSIVTVLLVIVCSIVGMLFALRQVPDFYAKADRQLPEPKVRREQARQLEQRTVDLVKRLEKSPDSWSESFEQQQINSWLVEELPENHSRQIPKGVSDPRVVLQPDRVQVGFKIDQPQWSGIVSVIVQPNIPSPNTIEFHIESISAGLVPVPYERFLPQINNALKKTKLPYKWIKNENGSHTLALSLGEKLKQQTIESIVVEDEKITINGRRLDAVTGDFHFRQVARQMGFRIE